MLEHPSLTHFCGIPLAELRPSLITSQLLDERHAGLTELDLKDWGIGVPGACVLAALLPSATSLTSLKCAAPRARLPMRSNCSAPPPTTRVCPRVQP